MDELSAQEIRIRAKRSVVLVAGRGVLLRLIQLAGLFLLARLLAPEAFGAVSFGMVFVGLATVAAQAGIGATLIRQPEEPEREDLSTLLGFQLATTAALVVIVAAVGSQFGVEGRITTLLVCSLPLIALRSPSTVLLERKLDYRGIVAADVVDTVVYYGWAVSAAFAGWGVWSLATAVLPRTAAGTLLLLLAVPEARVRPRISLIRLRRMLGFGVRLQLVDLINFGRDQGLTIGIAAISGLSVLGIWSYAYRIMQIPYILFAALWRVSFPAMARLVRAGEDLRPVIERTGVTTAIVTGAVLAPLVASATWLVPMLLGRRWQDVVFVLPPACLGILISGPISVSVAGYLYAIGDARSPLRATIVHTIGWQVVTFSLLPWLGVFAVGLGWFTAAIIDAVMLGRPAAAALGARILRPLLVPWAIAIVATGGGWLAGSASHGVVAVAASVAAAEAVFFGGLAITARRQLLDFVSLGRSLFGREGAATP